MVIEENVYGRNAVYYDKNTSVFDYVYVYVHSWELVDFKEVSCNYQLDNDNIVVVVVDIAVDQFVREDLFYQSNNNGYYCHVVQNNKVFMS